MKMFCCLVAGLALGAKLFAEDSNAPSHSKIGTSEAANYYDQVMIVTGKVAQVSIRPTVTFLNLDKPFPDSPFTIVIFHGHSSFYGDANALKGKSVEIEGKIKNYNDKPEIVLDNTNQLTVFDDKGKIIAIPARANTNAPAVILPTNAPPAMTPTNLSEIL